jgi:hypothetical protein
LALAKALKKMSYNKLSGDAIYQGLQELEGVDRQGVIGPCRYSKTSRRGSDQVRFYRVKNRKLVSISGWIKAPDGVSLHKW